MFNISTNLFTSDKRFIIGLILMVCLSTQGYSQAIRITDEGEAVQPFSQAYVDQYNATLEQKARLNASRVAVQDNTKMITPSPVGTCNLLTCGSFEKDDVAAGGVFRTAVGGTNGEYQRDAAYTCWNDVGTVDWSEGQYISYSNADANINTPGIISSSPDGGGFAIFSFDAESIDQTLSLEPSTRYTACFEIAVIPRYSNNDGSFVEFIPDLEFGVRNGAVQIPGGDPLTYTHLDLNIQPQSSFPTALSTATSGPFQNPGGWTDINPFWETVCITFDTANNANSVNVFYETGDPGRSVVLVDGLRLSLEGYATPPTLSVNEPRTFCIPTDVQLNDYVTGSGPTGSVLTWSTNTDPLVTADHLPFDPTVTTPGTWYGFYYNSDDVCSSPAVTLTLMTTDLDSSFTKQDVSCFGENDGSINLTVTGGAPPYTYAWTTINGSGLVATDQDQSGLTAGTYNVTITDDNGCSVSEKVMLSQPDEILPPVSGGNQTECEENPLQTLTATATVPLGQTIVWYNQAVGGSIVNSPTLNTVGTITYYAQANRDNDNCSSDTRTAVTLTINPAASAPISTGDITECEESPLQILDANDAITPTAGQSVVWYDAAAGGSVVPTPTLNAVGTVTYYAEGVTDADACSSLSRTAVTLTINPAASAPISTGDITECEESPLQILDANDAITPTAGQSVVWYDAAAGGSVVPTPTLNAVGTVTYYAEGVTDADACSSLSRTAVTLTINPAASAPISTGDITECNEDPLQTLNANDAITPTAGQSVVWYDAAAGGSVVPTPTLNAVGTVTYYAEGVTDADACSSLSRTAVTLTINPAASAPISTGDITECEESPLQTLDANDAITPTSGQSVVWYDAAAGGSVVPTPTLNAVGTVTYYAEGVTDADACSSLSRTAVTLTINPAASAPISTGDITECEESPLQILDANDAITPTAGQSVVWYDAAAGGSVVPTPTLNAVGTVTYYAEGVTDADACSSLSRTAVTLTINPAASAPISTGDITECNEDPLQTLNANDAITPTAGQSVVWYDAAAGGSVVPTPTLNAVGTVTYYAEGVTDANTCSSLSRTAVTLTLNNCGIEIEKIASPNNPQGCTPIAPGENITYTFNISNAGNAPIDNVALNDPLIDPNNPIPGPDSGDNSNPGILDVGEIWVYSATYTVTQPDIVAGQVQNTATITGFVQTSSNPYQVMNSDTVTVQLCQDADISITKSSSFAGSTCNSLAVNDIVDYSFEVKNEGDVDITNVVVTDAKLGGVIAGPTSGDAVNPGVLDVGETWTYEANYTVQQLDIDAGAIINTASVAGDTALGAVGSNSNTVTVLICQTAAIALVKEADVILNPNDNCYDVAVGGTIDYIFTVTNQGNVSLDNVVLTDDLLGNEAYVSGDANGDDILQVDETWIYNGSYTVTQADIDAGQVTNTATVTADDPADVQVSDDSGATINDDDDTVVAICRAAAIALVKEADIQLDPANNCYDVAVGGTIDYIFTVTNQGNVSLDNVVLTDDLLGNEAYVSGDANGDDILQVDETWIYNGSYTVTQADIDAGQVTNTATVTADDPADVQVSDDSGATINDDDDTVVAICQTAAIALVKEADIQLDPANNCYDVAVGGTIDYIFTVTNQGNVSLDNVVLTDDLLGNEAYVSGDANGDDILQVDETWIYSGSYTVTQADIDAGQVTNTATVTADDPADVQVSDDSGATINDDDDTVVAICRAAAIALVKEADIQLDPANNCYDVAVGGTIDYIFTVTNQGNVSLDNVVLTDDLLGNEAYVSGDANGDDILQVDETWIYNGSYTVTQADIDAGQVTNTATVTADDPADVQVSDDSGATINDDDDTVVAICRAAAIALVKEADIQLDPANNCYDVAVGGTIDYIFTVTNQGNVSLDNVVLTDDLLGNEAYVSGDANGDDILQVDETWIYSGSYTVTQADIDAGQVTNTATVTADDPADVQVSDDSGATINDDDDTVVAICQTAAIALVKEADIQLDPANNCYDVAVGGTIDYIFTVTNQGNVSLDNVVLTDDLLGNEAYVSGDANGDDILQVDETWIYNGSYTVTQADIDAGQVTNTATVTADDPADVQVSDDSGATINDDDDTVVAICQNAAIALVKEADVMLDPNDNCYDVTVGGMIDYIFTVTNEGNVSLDNVVLTDDLLGNEAFVSGDTNGDDILQVDETWIYNGSYTITQDDIDAGQVTNTATVTADDPNDAQVSDVSGATISDDDPTVTPICQGAAIAIVKASSYDDGGDCSDPGELINYTFTVTNVGNVSLSNIVVNDPLLGGVVAGPDSGDTDGDMQLDVTETWIYTGSYAITQDDIDAGEVVNQATAEGTAPDQSVVSDDSGSTTTTDDTTITPLCQSPAIAIVKASSYDDGGDCSDPGELINYTFTVTNEGNVSLSNIVVNDPLLGGVVAGPDSGDTDGDMQLDVTETWIYTGSYAITQDDIDAGEVVNQATAEGTAPDQSVVSDDSGSTTTTDDTTITPLCQSPAIAIVKASSYDDGGDCSDPGELINYTFTVTNEGNVSLSNIVVNDPLLGGVVAGPDSGDTDGDMQLDVTETWIYTGSYAITQDDIDAGEVVNQATAEGTAPDQSVVSDDSGSTTTTDDTTITPLCQSPAIAIVKASSYDDGGDCSDPGELINYTFTVTNEGNVSLGTIIVEDPLLGGVLPGPDSGDIDGDNALDVTETWIYTSSYSITQNDIDVGEVTNQATVQGKAPDSTVVNDDSGTTTTTDDPTITPLCQSPAIAIVKASSYDDGGDCSDPGDLINYTFTVTNEGNVSLRSIIVDDPLLGGVIAGPDSGDTNGDMELDVTETWIYTGSYAITQDDIDLGEVVNQAMAEGTAPDQTVVTDDSGSTTTTDDPTVTPICQGASIAIVKVSSYDPGGDCTQPGKSIDYTFTVTNTGNVSLAGVVVDDPLLGGVLAGPDSGDTDGDAELDVTETWIYTGSYAITQADIDAGQVTNRATVEGSAPDGSTVGDDSGTTATTDDATVTVLCQDPRVSLEKSGVFDDNNGDGIPQVGETISYAFTVTNTGSVTLFDLVLEDDLPGIEIMGGPIAELLPGQEDTDTFTGSYAITDRDIEQGQVVNQAIVRGLTSGGSEVNDISDDPNDPTDIDIDGDGDPDDPTVTILPNVEDAPVFEIFNGITPDGDGLNDFFNVFGIEEFGANNMKIYNRWGVLVWEADNYGGGNVFEGFSNGRATIREGKTLPTGTYFYILNFTTDDNPGEGNYTGYLYLNR